MRHFLKKIQKPTRSVRIRQPHAFRPGLGGYAQRYDRELNGLIGMYKDLMDDIITQAGASVVFPIDVCPLENYLTGYKFRYIPFDNRKAGQPQLEGYWGWDERQEGQVNIYYNTNASTEEQRRTVVHELIHVTQALDYELQNKFDALLLAMPKTVVERLLDEATEKATSMYLMPNLYFTNKYREINTEEELASHFKVSVENLRNRLKELGLSPVRVVV